MKSAKNRLALVFYFLVAAPAALVVLSALPQHAASPPPANEIVLGIDPAQSKVHWTLGTTFHTVHGTFAFKNGTLHCDPASGKANGEIVVFATSGDSGNDSRDKKMHKDVLESARFTDIIFRADRVEGKITPRGESTVQVHGFFLLHGR
jgi:polyisoprenoid-binding protein YceI